MTAATLERAPGVYEIDAADGTLDWEVVPVTHGPTWDTDPEWTGPRDPDGYILPRLTLGWQVLKWVEENLLAEETDDEGKPLPFKLTNEQQRFILWFYAIDEGDEYREPSGVFKYREVVLQRLKGAGKDPLAAVIAAVEFVGPCRFKGWVTFRPGHEDEDRAWAASHGLQEGEPYAVPHPRAWVQIAAVSLTQTQNTMKIFHGLFNEACIAKHGIDPGKEVFYAYGGQKQIQAVTSSPSALEGNRPTLVIMNETHLWVQNNNGLAMADVIERNATKSKGGAARTLAITNAFQPSVDSVGAQMREDYEDQAAGLTYSTGLMYDSLEAPGQARLRPILPDDLPTEEKERLTRLYLRRVLEVVRGDAWWLDIPSLTNSILSPRNPPSRSRRFYYNQIVAAEDAWLDPAAVDAAVSELAADARRQMDRDAREVLEAGWLVLPEEPIVMFFDGSKSDDATALVGCRVSDGYTFTIGVWQRPKGKRGESWLAPRAAVSARVAEAFARFNVVAFWGDPSHAKDDEDSTRYWDGVMDTWMREYKDRLDPAFWSVKSGHRKHAIMFDMATPESQKHFAAAAERFVSDMESLNDIEEYEPTFAIDGHPALVQHLKNGIRNPGPYGVTLMKDNRESAHKIDLAVCAVGAHMLRRVVLLGEQDEKEEAPAELWGVGF